MRRVFEPQSIADQAVLARLRHHVLKHLLKALDANAVAKMRAVGVIGNRGMHAQRQKPTERHVGDRAFHDLAVGQAIVKAQEQNLEHADRINGRPAKIRIVATNETRPKGLEVDARHDLAKVMVLRDDRLEDSQIEFGQRCFGGGFQHGVGPPEASAIDAYWKYQMLSCQTLENHANLNFRPPGNGLFQRSQFVPKMLLLRVPHSPGFCPGSSQSLVEDS